MRKIEIVPYNPEWPRMFENEATLVRAAFGSNLVTLHHIGSTSVPGLSAKPILDMLAEVRDINAVDEINPAMTHLGYQALGEYGLPERRYFRKPSDEFHTHHVHAYQTGSGEVERHLAYRDYLRTHPADARAYAELKEKLARAFPFDATGYMNGKNSFVKDLERRAVAWSRDGKLDFYPLTPQHWDDFETLFGLHGAFSGCWCMWFYERGKEFAQNQGEPNRLALKARVDSGQTPGILAYQNGTPVGWCAFAPRAAYPRLAHSRTLKPLDDTPVWSVTCFYIAKAFRGQGLTVKLLKAVQSEVKARGGKVIEGYPTQPKEERTNDAWLFAGLVSAFLKAGFIEVAHPTETRRIMRYTIQD